ncbi:MAG: hypothetical protein A2731_01890 [Candidatus Buchananbacteria bacterium RIFCSPHIGHO2_01_FULL_39_8]|uniref:Beta-hydroxyacyl-ACP dehydratase n=1 Tax=Candidatus Buchananbacteria bacterium RIFCSPHIGHO2_01_FULL_39_8 TaxID=1797533 RepID=A0A1G1XYU0_9BACT|nr:MAG: hypothetical protein A2731_01890 [Candidatus Buchananbacteria bacterium RIFCSPHIGHO2_01_FULL_39_8]
MPTDLQIQEVGVLDLEAIQQILFHRGRMLLVDRVKEFDQGHRELIAELLVTADHCAGHCPNGQPVFRGVDMVEALAQAAGLLARLIWSSSEFRAFRGTGEVIFRRKVVPGETLSLRVKLIDERLRGALKIFDGEVWVGEEVAASVKNISILFSNPS